LDAALQRSINAEKALAGSLGRAVLIVRPADDEIVFATREADTLLARHGGAATLMRALHAGTNFLGDANGGRLEICLQPAPEDALSLLVTLHGPAATPSVAALNVLGLTPRETEILFWVAQGKTSPEIAVILNMQVCTVKKHVGNFLPKLGVETRLAAALRAQ